MCAQEHDWFYFPGRSQIRVVDGRRGHRCSGAACGPSSLLGRCPVWFATSSLPQTTFCFLQCGYPTFYVDTNPFNIGRKPLITLLGLISSSQTCFDTSQCKEARRKLGRCCWWKKLIPPRLTNEETQYEKDQGMTSQGLDQKNHRT